MTSTETTTMGQEQAGGEANGAIDMQTIEKLTTPIVGLALLVHGLKRKSVAGAAIAAAGGGLIYRGLTGESPVSLVSGDGAAAKAAKHEHEAGAAAGAPELERWITIGKPADELYRLWRDPNTVPKIMEGIATVDIESDDRARWTVETPLGKSLTWETRIVEDRPGELIRWESVEGAEVPNEGTVSFKPAPADWGTEVSLQFRFEPPGGALGEGAFKLVESIPIVGDFVPNLLAGKALRRFKSLAETGEIPRSSPQPSGR